MVEQRIENPRVGGSNPPPGTISSSIIRPLAGALLAGSFSFLATLETVYRDRRELMHQVRVGFDEKTTYLR